ncbi:MAG TPA: pyridoxal-phosphate dependent enzyme [Spirochaetota bacterium]|nr:MAG: D-cysteine desulfhydrase [Spirochaetes bacterium ADurb.BinA120]HPO45251.1 pyridoxal-phosphate dependent enzyme [Spirochaetota bacterium]
MNNTDQTLPIFREYPGLGERLPRIPLGAFPTPVRKLECLDCDNLWVKRDDLSAAAYGGNKVRKLEFILGEAKRLGKRDVVTIGGIGTNHGLATAIYCKKLGIKCTLLLFEQPVTSYVKRNLLLYRYFGARTIFTGSLPKTVLAYFLTHRLFHPAAHYVFAGGSDVYGTVGFVNAAFELRRQVEEGLMPEPTLIVCPLGSNGTLAGLALGVRLAGLRARVTGVRVTAPYLGPIPASTPGAVSNLMAQTLRFLRRADSGVPAVSVEAPEVLDDYFGDGYGCPTAACCEAIDIMKIKEGLDLEPTYTGKTFAAVVDMVRQSRTRDEVVLYWHTYNSADLSREAASVDYHDLPAEFHRFFEMPEVPVPVCHD